MSDPSDGILDFSAVDDLAFAAERGRLRIQDIGPIKLDELGPMLELLHISKTGILPSPGEAPFVSSSGLSAMLSAISSTTQQWISPLRHTGLFKTATEKWDETAWTKFGLAVQQSALRSGFSRPISSQLAAAMGELHSNVYEHSGAPETGIAAFHAADARFEFVVADQGIGILESLRSADEYSALRDHGEALHLALTDGISRFAAERSRGHGFRPIFVGLANLNGRLRFRSGDHALLIDGRRPSVMTARISQKPSLPGFFVSYSCTLGAQRGFQITDLPSGARHLI